MSDLTDSVLHDVTAPRLRRRSLRDLPRARDAVILIEFAYSLPILMMLAFGAIELGNLAISNMRVSQIAMTVADNLSRAKQSVNLNLPQLREVDINDALLGARIQGSGGVNILTKGRIVVSSLQQNDTGNQRIFWQRCKGVLRVDGAYGVEGATQGTTPGFTGMGAGTNKVQAAPASAIIFAEVTYDYEPLVGAWALGTFRIRREAAFYVRDERDLTQVYNPNPTATPSRCDVYSSSFS